jgi:hypothetical protein
MTTEKLFTDPVRFHVLIRYPHPVTDNANEKQKIRVFLDAQTTYYVDKLIEKNKNTTQ